MKRFKSYLQEELLRRIKATWNALKSAIMRGFKKDVKKAELFDEVIITIPGQIKEDFMSKNKILREGAVAAIKGNYNEALVMQFIYNYKGIGVSISNKYEKFRKDINATVSKWDKQLRDADSKNYNGNIKIINSVPKKQNNHSMYLEIPINAPESILLSQVKDLLHEEFKKRKLDGKYLFPSNLKYKMEVSKNFQHQVWIKRLECIQLQDEGKTRLQIGKKLNIGDGQGEYCKRQVSRNIELGKKLLKNVEKGKFNVDFVKVKKLVKK